MGIAELVPGVSGGTIAFVTGIYEEFLSSINNITLSTFKTLKNKGFSAFWKKLNGNFLVVLFGGMLVSILSFSKLISWLLEFHPIPIWSFFFGLVLASVIFVAKAINKWNLATIVLFALGAVTAFYITTLPPSANTDSLPFLFFSGALAICAMVLPGISGSFILVLLGSYKTILDAVNDKDYKIIITVGLGVVFGILSFARLLKWMFEHYKNITLAVLTGFILGSLNKIWPWKNILEVIQIGKKEIIIDENISPFSFEGDPQLSFAIVAFVGGFYEEFIYSLQKINGKAFKLLFNGRFKSFYRYVNGSFLTLLLSGMLISYFSISKVLDYFLEHKELYVWAAFFGMILGSIYYIGKDFDHWTNKTISAAFIGLAVGIAISFLNPATENDNLFFIFLCGMISVSGMTLPGLSGSFILMLLGNYVLLLVDSVNALYDTFLELLQGDFSFIYNPERLDILTILAVFTLGSATGLVTLSHILSYVLKFYKHRTTAVILGFITGSLGVVWPWKRTIYKLGDEGTALLDSNGKHIIVNYERFFPNFQLSETWWALFFVLFGISILLLLDWYGKNRRQTS